MINKSIEFASFINHNL